MAVKKEFDLGKHKNLLEQLPKKTGASSRVLPASLPRLQSVEITPHTPSGGPSHALRTIVEDTSLPDDAMIEGVSVRDIRLALQASKAETARGVPDRVRQESKKIRMHDLKQMLLKERLMRGEERSAPQDRKWLKTLKEALKKENVLPTLQKNLFQGDDFAGIIDPELRKTHDTLPPKIRMNLADTGSANGETSLQKRVAGVLKDLHEVTEAEDMISQYSTGKPIGIGLPGFSNRAVLGERGVRIYAGGGGAKKDAGDADVTIEWEDIRNGTYTVGVAPSGLDWFFRLIGNKGQRSRLATMVVTERGTERRWTITAPGGHRLVENLRRGSAILARKPIVEDTLQDLVTDSKKGDTVRRILKRLDNS